VLISSVGAVEICRSFPLSESSLLVICRSLCFGSRLRLGLWGGQSSFDAHEQFGSYFSQVPQHDRVTRSVAREQPSLQQ
jgi:hypothetical protein